MRRNVEKERAWGRGGAGRDGDFLFESGDKCVCGLSRWVSERQVGKSPSYRRETKLRATFPHRTFNLPEIVDVMCNHR